MPGVVKTGRPLAALTAGKHGPGHLEFFKFSGQRNQPIAHCFSLRQFVQAVAQREQRVERNQALTFHDRANPAGQFLPDLLTGRMGLAGSRQQRDDFALGKIGPTGRRPPQIVDRRLGRIEKLGRGRNPGGKRTHHLLPGFVQILRRDLALARQDLPESDVGLKDPQRIGAQGDIGNVVEASTTWRKWVIEASSRPWNSEKIRYWLP